MQGSRRELDEIFRQMDRMRKAWEHVSPSKKLNKSQFGTLFALARLSGGREQCPGCDTPMQSEATVKTEAMAQGEGAAKPEAGVQGENAAKTVSPAQGGNAVNAALPAQGTRAANAGPRETPECAAPAAPAVSTEPAAKPVTLSELAAAMHQSLPALSQRVTVLEEKGFVERVADPADRRVTGLRLTETGRSEMDTAFRRFSGILAQAAGRVGRQNMQQLLQLLGELADALNEAAEAVGRE